MYTRNDDDDHDHDHNNNNNNNDDDDESYEWQKQFVTILWEKLMKIGWTRRINQY